MTWDWRAAKRAKLSDNDAKPDSFAQGDLAASSCAYGGFEPAPLLQSIHSGRGCEAADSLPAATGPLLPLTATGYGCSPSQMPTMDCYPGMVDLVSFPFLLCQEGKKSASSCVPRQSFPPPPLLLSSYATMHLYSNSLSLLTLCLSVLPTSIHLRVET